jgi:hypothetical protein
LFGKSNSWLSATRFRHEGDMRAERQGMRFAFPLHFASASWDAQAQSRPEPSDRQKAAGWRMHMSRTARSVSLVVIVFFAVGSVLFADPPTVSIQQQADLIPGLGIFVHVVVNCGDGQTDGTIQVGARQGNYASDNVDTVVNAANKQEVTVFIFGPTFVPGDGQASATLACGLLISGLDLGRTIKIAP